MAQPEYETATAHALRPAHVRAKARQMRRENMTPAEQHADRKQRLDELEALARRRRGGDDRGAAA